MSVGAQKICLSSWTAGSREEMEICQSEALDSEEVALKVQRMLFFGFIKDTNEHAKDKPDFIY